MSNDQKVEALVLGHVLGKFNAFFVIVEKLIIEFISDLEAAVEVDRVAEAKARVRVDRAAEARVRVDPEVNQVN